MLSALCFASLLLNPSGPIPMDRTLHPDLQRYVNERVLPAVENIPAERKESLDLIAAFIKEREEEEAEAYGAADEICRDGHVVRQGGGVCAGS